MATLNLSTNGPSIAKSYESVVNAPPPAGAKASSPTYGQWAVFSVQAPLVSAFQQNSGGKESVLKVQSSGEGELEDLIEEFSDGRVQFAFVKVQDPNTGLPKNVLVAWCGEGVPERTKGYFTSHLAAVSKLLHGYHVQVTARSDRDLTPEGIIQKVSDASGAKYSAGTAPPPPASAPKPAVASKPVFTPSRIVGSVHPSPTPGRSSAPKREDVDNDGWGADAPPVTRTQLEKVQPAYQPTKVNMKDILSQKSATTSSDRSDNSRPDVVKGGYQPVGKVDIAAIRRQARESGQTSEERPEPVKGAYQPVGKVDIAAIRAKAQGGTPEHTVSPQRGMSPAVTGASAGDEQPKSLAERSAAFTSSERLTSLPKPKVSSRFGATSNFTGTKAPVPGGFEAKPLAPGAPVGGASRTFADEGGKTPAQIWAEKKAKERGGLPTPTPPSETQPLQSQESGGWKSSYTGKSWAPVQTTHTGTSSRSAGQGQIDEIRGEQEEPQPVDVGAMREKFAGAAPMGAPASSGYERAAPPPPPAAEPEEPPAPTLPVRSREPEDVPAEEHYDVPPPPQQPRSPTPEPSSPIRVAMPIGRGTGEEHVADAHAEQYSPPQPLPVESMAHAVPAEEELEEPAHDPARDVAQTAAAVSHAPVSESPPAAAGGAGIRAMVIYDYEKTADDELELRENEYVTNIEMVDADWWAGMNARGEQGLFPSNYVEVVRDGEEGAGGHHQPTTTEEQYESEAPAARPTATALYDYEAAEDNEIGFPDGAKITNIEFAGENWWLGEYNGKLGLFPSNYVQLDQ